MKQHSLQILVRIKPEGRNTLCYVSTMLDTRPAGQPLFEVGMTPSGPGYNRSRALEGVFPEGALSEAEIGRLGELIGELVESRLKMTLRTPADEAQTTAPALPTT